MNSSNVKIALVLTAIITVFVIFAGLIWVGKDVAAVVYLVGAVLVPTISAVMGIKVSTDTRDKVDKLQQDADEHRDG